jgi:hypothetical protein
MATDKQIFNQRLYSVAMLAMRLNGPSDNNPGWQLHLESSVASANSEEDAEAIAMSTILEQCKVGGGWINHIANAKPIIVEGTDGTPVPIVQCMPNGDSRSSTLTLMGGKSKADTKQQRLSRTRLHLVNSPKQD